jgi:F-box and WD-40 domain protein CDC4
LGEPPGGLYDEDIFSDDGYEDEVDMKTRNLSGMEEDDFDEQEQADIDAMDQDLVASESESVVEIEFDESGQEIQQLHGDVNIEISDIVSEGVDSSRWAPASAVTLPVTPSRPSQPPGKAGGAGPSRGLPFEAAGPSLPSIPTTVRLPSTDETPTRPRIRNHPASRRR